jgi:hypothetical protein
VQIDQNQEETTSNITIEIPETKYYKNASRNIRLIVYKDSPYITSPNTINSNKYETIVINATLNLNRDVLVENITGIVKINGKTMYQGKFINGVLRYKLVLNDNYKNDEYNITIKSKETSKYHTAVKNITLTLNTRPTYIASKNIVSKNGEKIIINASIYDRITRKFVKGSSKACIKINEVTLENIVVNNGHLVYSYVNDYSAKNYSIKIIYGGNGIYNHSEWDGTLTITSSPLSIMTNNINANAYSDINIKANIMDGNNLAEGIIKTAIKINNKTIIESNITTGIIDLNYTLPDDLGSGTHNLTIIAGDTRKYTHNITTVELIVNKNYKHVESSDIVSAAGNTIKINARLLDLENNLITKKTPVNIKIGGESVATFDVVDGTIEYDYMLPESMEKGLYDIVIQAGETRGYYHATTNNVLTVE